MAGFSAWEKRKLNNAAAGLYMSEPGGAEATGLSWQELDEEEKDMWRTKAVSKGNAHPYDKEDEE